MRLRLALFLLLLIGLPLRLPTAHAAGSLGLLPGGLMPGNLDQRVDLWPFYTYLLVAVLLMKSSNSYECERMQGQLR